MKKINIGQRFELTEDMHLKTEISQTPIVIKKGTVLFTGVDGDWFHMLNGKMIQIDKSKNEITKGYSVTGLAEWIYQRISGTWNIDEMLEEQADYDETGLPEQAERFKRDIGEALEELGFYDYTGNTL